jgi:FKBP-type peptidyl-prolyl cis-trans isomerase FklB
MLRAVCLTGYIFISANIFSQNTKKVTVSSQKPAAAKPVAPKVLKDLRDSVSYTAGIHIVNKYRSQNIYNFNSSAVAKAVDDIQTKKSPLLTNAEADNVVFSYQSQLTENPNQPRKTPVAGVVLNDLCDSASYAAGLYLVSFFNQFEISNFNSVIISRAIQDLQSQKKPLLNDSLANMVALRYQLKLQEVKNKPTIDAGKKFLAKNKTKPTVKTTKSGLQYEVIKTGDGPKPTKKDKVSCNYIGTYIDGTEFENSYKSGQPVVFGVTQVIPGWSEALQMMPVGSKWKLYIPYNLGYGPGQYHAIPGGSVLVFELELLGIEK